jgi:hypothetical protein
VAAFTIHFDDSGTHPTSPIAVAAGWISPYEQWKKFIKAWNRARVAEGFDVFHMSEFMASNPKTEFASWDNEKKVRVMRRLRGIIEDHATMGFGFAVHKDDYEQLVTGDVRKKFGEFHYTWAVRVVIGMVENWRERKRIKEPTEYIFDRMSQGRAEIDKVFADAEATGAALHRYGIFRGCHSFRDKAEVLPLQAADIFAWLLFQRARSRNV